MTKTKKIIVATTAVAVVGATYYYISATNQLFERYPDVDQKTARKAFHQMVLNGLAGKYADTDLNNDAVCEDVFFTLANSIKYPE